MPNFHLIPWCGDYGETYSSNPAKLNGNCGFPEISTQEVVHLTFPPHIFYVQVNSGACYIMGQWGGGRGGWGECRIKQNKLNPNPHS